MDRAINGRLVFVCRSPSGNLGVLLHSLLDLPELRLLEQGRCLLRRRQMGKVINDVGQVNVSQRQLESVVV